MDKTYIVTMLETIHRRVRYEVSGVQSEIRARDKVMLYVDDHGVKEIDSETDVLNETIIGVEELILPEGA